jgi:hypothetical protein
MQATITPGKKPKQASRNLTQEIDEQPTVPVPRPPLQFAAYPVGLTAPERTLRREELYDDYR